MLTYAKLSYVKAFEATLSYAILRYGVPPRPVLVATVLILDMAWTAFGRPWIELGRKWTALGQRLRPTCVCAKMWLSASSENAEGHYR